MKCILLQSAKFGLFVWLLVFAPAAPTFSSPPIIFVDCDGDGFDDNAPDDDADGIPDECERHGFISAGTSTLPASRMFSGPITVLEHKTAVGCGDRFGSRKFALRAVCENRTDFDAGFGSGFGIGGGVGAGGGCAGGVCF